MFNKAVLNLHDDELCEIVLVWWRDVWQHNHRLYEVSLASYMTSWLNRVLFDCSAYGYSHNFVKFWKWPCANTILSSYSAFLKSQMKLVSLLFWRGTFQEHDKGLSLNDNNHRQMVAKRKFLASLKINQPPCVDGVWLPNGNPPPPEFPWNILAEVLSFETSSVLCIIIKLVYLWLKLFWTMNTSKASLRKLFQFSQFLIKPGNSLHYEWNRMHIYKVNSFLINSWLLNLCVIFTESVLRCRIALFSNIYHN